MEADQVDEAADEGTMVKLVNAKTAIIAVVLGLLVWAIVTEALEPPSPLEDTVAEVTAEIESLDSCSALQRKFDIAHEHHQRNHDAGKYELARISTHYMEVADDRMREIGCYD